MKTLLPVICLFVISLAAGQNPPAAPPPPPPPPAVMTGMIMALNNMMNMTGGAFASYLQGVVASKVMDAMNPMTPMTMFSVPNEVHRMMMSGDMGKAITENPEMMRRTIGRHIVLEKLLPSNIHNDMVVNSLSGDLLRFNIYGSVMTANGAVITMEPQMTTQNLVMYRLNRMIMPSMAKGLMELLNKQKDRFSTFINLIQSSGMANTLEQGGPFTVFAPTNDAFKALPDGTLSSASMATQQRIVLRHVISGSFFLSGLMTMNNQELPTQDEGSHKIAVNGTAITIGDGAKILMTNNMPSSNNMIMAMFSDNGVLHAIDRVLPMPSAMKKP